MVSIARSSLLFEWRRYTTAVLAVTFAGLLVVIQLALLLGLFGSVSMAIDKSSAALWIGFKDTQSVDLGRPIRPASDAAAWAHPGVARVERYVSAYGDLRRPDGVATAFIRMPSFAHSSASVRVRASMPAFAAVACAMSGQPR